MQDSSILAALVVAARRHGVELRVDELRRNFSLTADEPESIELVGIARELGLEIKSLQLKWKDLSRLKNSLPAILRLKDGTALLLDAVNDSKTTGQIAIVHDPRDPPDVQAAIDETRLALLWDGEVLLVKRHFSFGDEQKPFGVGWIAARLLHERKLFRDICLTALVNIVFILTPVVVARITLGRVLVGYSSATLVALTVFFGVTIFLEAILIYVRQRLLEAITTRVDGHLQLYLLDKVLKLPVDYFERNSVGRIITKLSQVHHVRAFLTGELFITMLDLLTASILLPILFFISWLLALFVVLWSTVVFLIVLAFLRPLRDRHRLTIAAETEKYAYLTESVYGMRTIKSLAIESRRRLGWDPRIAKVVAARYELGRAGGMLRALTAPFERLITSGSFIVGSAIYLYYVNALSQPAGKGAGAAVVGNMTIGNLALSTAVEPWSLVAFVILSGNVVSPLMRGARLMLEVQEIRGGIGEIAGVVNTPEEETRAGTGMRLPIQGHILFQNVRFRYSSDAPYALDGVSCDVPPGTVLGIMGRSGSGKTTITRLLQGLHQDYEGIIKIDGMDLREIDLHYLRTNIGVVAQENFLFTGSIRENIGMARPDATMAEIVRAAQLAGAEEFIEKLPQGYNTRLSEGAANLSGGQRQRLAIARALILDPPVLILDEATSALDAESEAIINANLRRIAENRTIICVSHRLSMLVSANAILVMEKGKPYDIGSHDELMKRCDIYRHMWYQQNRHLDPSASHGPIAIVHSAQV